MNIVAPDLNLEALVPEVIVTVLAVVLLLADLFLRGTQKRALTWVSLAGYGLALAACVYYFFVTTSRYYAFGNPANAPQDFHGAMVVQDQLGLFLRMLIVITAIIGTLF